MQTIQPPVVNAAVLRRLRSLHKRGAECLATLEGELFAADRDARESWGRVQHKYQHVPPDDIQPLLLEVPFVEDGPGRQAIQRSYQWLRELQSYADTRLPNELRNELRTSAPVPGPRIRPAGQGVTIVDYVNEFRSALGARLAILERVTGISSAVGDIDDRDREAAGGWAHLRGGNLIDPTVLDGYLATMRTRRTRADRAAALAAAKELVEAVFKGYLLTQDPSFKLDKVSLPGLWDKIRDKLVVTPDIDPGLGGRDVGVEKLGGRLADVIAGLTEVRNRAGRGHGRPAPVTGLAESHVLLAIDSAFTLTRFVAQRHRERG